MSCMERIEVLRKIYNEGVFPMKGAVHVVAEEMGVSVPTLNKYLQEVKK
ncbi:helix-turn-helix domain-containing protein [Collinsella tanakaei]|nr:helix-turn-helix domain-containing protein [Collinsella tanakaei]